MTGIAFAPVERLAGWLTVIDAGTPVQISVAGSPIRLFQCAQMWAWFGSFWM